MLRLAIVLGLACWIAAPAHANPKVAVAPIGGDPDDAIAAIVVDVVGDAARVVRPAQVVKTIARLGISGDLDNRDAQRVMKKLAANAVLQGRIQRAGKARVLRVTAFVRGGKPKTFGVTFRSSKMLRERLRAQLEHRLALGRDRDDDREDDRGRKRTARRDDDEDDDRRERKREARRRDRDDDDDDDDRGDRRRASRRRDRDDDERGDRRRKRTARRDDDDEDDDDRSRVRRRRGDDDDDEDRDRDDRDDRDDDGDRPRRPRAAMVWVDAGTSLGVRRLTYTAATPPPRVGTFGAAVRFDAALYPLAGDRGAAAGLGVAASVDKVVGLAIQVPAGGQAPIDQAQYAIGARYRVALGRYGVAFGADYVKRRYVADRSQLAAPTDLDMPDVDYTAVAPGVAVRAPVGRRSAVFGAAAALLILDAGPIQENDSYGAATVFGGTFAGGVDIGLSDRLALRLAGELAQISFAFEGNGAEAMARGVTGATDRTFGVAATLGVTY